MEAEISGSFLQILEEFYNIFGPELKAVTGDPKRIEEVLVRVDALVTPLEEVSPKAIFFYFLVYGSSDPKFLHFRKKIKIIFTFFIFSDVKKLPDLKKKYFQKNNNKNCMILHCKNAEMTIINAEMTIFYCHFCIFTV